jgi:protein-glutamine gamma-glutamyltransferase
MNKISEFVVKAARELHKAGISFRTFRSSICNEKYWNRTNEGGFLLREDAKPSEAIKDIYNNGHKYGTECATAIVIVFYRAAAYALSEEQFNNRFSSIYLMNWRRVDRDLKLRYYEQVPQYLPGDCRYFKNPEVNPLTPQWQGENVIDLGDGTYYGHGIGITNAEGIINALNSNRRSGATKSAYLHDSVTRMELQV